MSMEPERTETAPKTSLGPRLDPEVLKRTMGGGLHRETGPTWRGWTAGLCATVFLTAITPYVEFYLSGSQIEVNLLPTGPLVILAGLIIVNMLFRRAAPFLSLTPQDLTLVTCMTWVSAAIPGYGFIAYLSGSLAYGQYQAGPNNQWAQYVLPHFADWLLPHDPLDPNMEGVAKPLSWFMSGKPPDAPIPYGAWVLPYMYWSLMALFLFGMMFTVCSLLRRQWVDRERLPFPLAQVPLEMMNGLPGTDTENTAKPFFRDKAAWVGMSIPLLLHSWNSIRNLRGFGNWPAIPLNFKGLETQYLTTEPLSYLGPISIYIFPSVIGLTYLLSLEVGFSLWFFYFVQKAAAFTAVTMGLGKSHADFYDVGGHNGFIIDQGTGALFAMVLFGLWMSRSHLSGVFLRALGLRPPAAEDDEEALSHRTALLVFLVCFIGAVVWLSAAGVALGYALLVLVLFLIIMTGITRLAAEGGLFYVQTKMNPADLAQLFCTPESMGASVLAPLSLWSRIFAFDWGRTSPMPGMMNSLKLSADTRLRKRPLALGIAVAMVVSLVLTFFVFFHVVYSSEGGARSLEGVANGWTFKSPPKSMLSAIGGTSSRLEQLLDKFDENFSKELHKSIAVRIAELKKKSAAESVPEKRRAVEEKLKRLENDEKKAVKVKAKLAQARKKAREEVALTAFKQREEEVVKERPGDWWKDVRRLPGAMIAAGLLSEEQVLEAIKNTRKKMSRRPGAETAQPSDEDIGEAAVKLKFPAPVKTPARRQADDRAKAHFVAEIKTLLCKTRAQALREARTRLLQMNNKRLPDVLIAEKIITVEEAGSLAEKAKLTKADLPVDVARRNWWRIGWMAFGAVMMVLFMIIRTRIFWFPHPIGYVVWMHPQPMAVLWFSLFVGWLLKWAIVKYGGFKVYGRMKRLFVGLVVGEVIAAAIWITVFGITDTPAETKTFYRINIDP